MISELSEGFVVQEFDSDEAEDITLEADDRWTIERLRATRQHLTREIFASEEPDPAWLRICVWQMKIRARAVGDLLIAAEELPSLLRRQAE